MPFGRYKVYNFITQEVLLMPGLLVGCWSHTGFYCFMNIYFFPVELLVEAL